MFRIILFCGYALSFGLFAAGNLEETELDVKSRVRSAELACDECEATIQALNESLAQFASPLILHPEGARGEKYTRVASRILKSDFSVDRGQWLQDADELLPFDQFKEVLGKLASGDVVFLSSEAVVDAAQALCELYASQTERPTSAESIPLYVRAWSLAYYHSVYNAIIPQLPQYTQTNQVALNVKELLDTRTIVGFNGLFVNQQNDPASTALSVFNGILEKPAPSFGSAMVGKPALLFVLQSLYAFLSEQEEAKPSSWLLALKSSPIWSPFAVVQRTEAASLALLREDLSDALLKQSSQKHLGFLFAYDGGAYTVSLPGSFQYGGLAAQIAGDSADASALTSLAIDAKVRLSGQDHFLAIMNQSTPCVASQLPHLGDVLVGRVGSYVVAKVVEETRRVLVLGAGFGSARPEYGVANGTCGESAIWLDWEKAYNWQKLRAFGKIQQS